MSKPIGIILYKGPSLIDGKMIVALASGVFKKTDNRKTGDMIQVWIERADISPEIGKQLGHDYSVCGDCKHRHFGSCYVNIGYGPLHTFEAYVRDRYVKFDDSHLELFRGRKIRLGSYGDPAAVPTEVWEKVCSVTDGHTGYTHQWNKRFTDPKLKDYCMASVDNEAEYHKAKKLGWRTFRVRMSENDALMENEFVCPASNEAGNKTSCEKCKACMGLGAKTKKDACIIVHGLEAKIAKFKWGMERIAWKEKYRKDFQYPKPKKKKRKRRKAPEVKILEPMLV